MLREALFAKIHHATVTFCDENYVGSITIDADLLDACGMRPNEKVLVADCTSGARFETYIFKGKKGSGAIEINGAAAHLVEPGDPVIIMHYALMTDKEYKKHKPKVLIIGPNNSVKDVLTYGNK